LRKNYLLGHKSIANTDRYIQLVPFEGDEYYSETAKTVEEARKLIESGYSYVCDFEGYKLFKKAK